MPIQDVKPQKLDPIDAVITWVDGDDPKLKAKQQQYFSNDRKSDNTSADRFADLGEIYYCIALILKNAPFINRIFIVTDNQYPSHIDRIKNDFGNEAFKKIIVVDHTDIFRGFEQYLPVFNSTSIEAMLHRIPGLSDRYIYFNDDFFIGRKVTEEDFFIENSPVLRGKFRAASSAEIYEKQRMRKREGKIHLRTKDFSYKEYQFLAFKLRGSFDSYFWHDHVPHPFFRPRLELFFENNRTVLEENISFRIRHHSQWDTMSLANCLEIENGNDNFQPTMLTYLKPSAKHFQSFYIKRKKRSFYRRNNLFFCVQALNSASLKTQKSVVNWLEAVLYD